MSSAQNFVIEQILIAEVQYCWVLEENVNHMALVSACCLLEVWCMRGLRVVGQENGGVRTVGLSHGFVFCLKLLFLQSVPFLT
jgi:hypothetical protein